MANMPTKTMLRDWIISNKAKALSAFDASTRAKVNAYIIGTEIEEKCIEWKECVQKMGKLHKEMYPDSYSSFRYNEDDYKYAIIGYLVKEKYGKERDELQNEFAKVLKGFEKINSPKKILEYLKTCDMEYPETGSIKEEVMLEEINVSVYKPWIHPQVTSGDGNNETNDLKD